MRLRPHVLYVTPIFGYPPFGGPRLRTYNTLKALARCADVSLYLTQPPDTADREQARAHLLTFCRDVVFPEPLPGPSFARRALYRLLPPSARSALRALRRPNPFGREETVSAREAPSQGDPSPGAGARSLRDPAPGGPGDPARGEPPLGDPSGGEAPSRDPAVLANLRDRIEANKPDLLWLGFGGISYDLLPLKQETGTPVVLETECVWSRFILRELPFATDPRHRAWIAAAGRAKEAEERLGAQIADITTAVSEVDAEYFRSIAPDHLKDRVMLLHNVIDVDAYADPPPRMIAPDGHTARATLAIAQDGQAERQARVDLEQPALVFAGTLSHGTANVDATHWLIDEVMPRVWRRRPDVHLYLVGRSPTPSILARRSQRVHVTGEVASIMPYLRASTAALVPLRWESGTRFKILEAFACKTPVISTTLGAEGLDVADGRHLLLADAPDAFAEAILSLLEDPARGQALVGPAYELVRQAYDLSSAERQIGAVLARLGLSVPVGAR